MNAVNPLVLRPLLFSLLLLPLAAVPVTAQEDHAEESGDEIIRRELFLHEKRAGGPGRSVPGGAYEQAFAEKRRLEAEQEMSGRTLPLAPWISLNPSGMFYQRTNANYLFDALPRDAPKPRGALVFLLVPVLCPFQP